MVCPKCGANIEPTVHSCQFCGHQVAPQVNVYQSSPTYGAPLQSATRCVETDIPGFNMLTPYYQEEFRKIYESKEVYKGKFNGYAFFFNLFWGLSKGLWVSMILWMILSAFTMGVAGVIYYFYMGFRGNYLYYKLIAERKQPIL